MQITLFNDYLPGLVTSGGIIDLSEVFGPTVMVQPFRARGKAMIENFDAFKQAIEAVSDSDPIPFADVQLRAPVQQPQNMLFAQGNYFEETDSAILPLSMFLKAPSSILEPGGTVCLSEDDAIVFHHEAELGVIIGKSGRNISPEDAMDHIFGYCCIIDVSARGIGRGLDFADKSPETFCPIGPWITTKDSVPEPQKLSVQLHVNDQIRQDYNTSDMEHPVTDLVSWASEVLTLQVGDVIACGTNHGGLGPLQNGDKARMSIEGLGELAVSVTDPLQREWPSCIDPGMQAAVIKMRTTGTIPSPDEMFTVRRTK